MWVLLEGNQGSQATFNCILSVSPDITCGLDVAFCPPGFLLVFPSGFNFKLVKEKISDSTGKAVLPIYSLCLEVTSLLL